MKELYVKCVKVDLLYSIILVLKNVLNKPMYLLHTMIAFLLVKHVQINVNSVNLILITVQNVKKDI